MEKTRINKNSDGTSGQKFFLLIHHGYDFDPTTLAICSSYEKAEEMRGDHYKVPENKDYPWNGVSIIGVFVDSWVEYKNSDERSLTSLAQQAGLLGE